MTAIDQTEFSRIMEDIFDPADLSGPLAVAVSGGADSLCLTLLLSDWCKELDIQLIALTVDHGLRPEAREEARQVADWMAEAGIDHHILTYQGSKPENSIQDQARQIRYELMGKWCESHQVGTLFLAHHQDDQAETLLIRLARGSGVDGLAAMQKKTDFPFGHSGPLLCRPLLDITKSRLEATLEARGHDWINDPSNKNESFLRVQARAFLNNPAIDGMTSQRLADTAQHMQRVKGLLDSLIDDAARKSVRINDWGYAEVNLADLRQLHQEIALRLLSRLIKTVSGENYGPRFHKLENLYENLLLDGFAGQTLSGTLADMKDGHIRICREPAAIEEAFDLSVGQKRIWDNRFVVSAQTAEGRLTRITADIYHAHKTQGLEIAVIPEMVRFGLPCMMLQNGGVIFPKKPDALGDLPVLIF